MRETCERAQIIKLFEPFENKTFPVKNRFVRAATWLGACDGATGRATPAAISRQAETAAGGAGTVISEFAYVSPARDRLAPKQWGIDVEEAVRATLRQLSAAVHGAGSKLVVQICHAGGARMSASSRGLPAYSPSGGEYPGSDIIAGRCQKRI